jgi:pseudouridylate synthase
MLRVALETAVLTHGLPRPQNVETALRLEGIVREEGARGVTVGVLNGRAICGLERTAIEALGQAEDVRKISLRDLPVALARGASGGTTVAATLHIAAQKGVHVFATGGIGGVHRDAEGRPTGDVSADIHALATYPMITVCAGAKSILHLSATLEMLESLGVTVLGYRTDELPAFYSRESGLPVDAAVETPEEAAAVLIERRRIGLAGGVILAAPIPTAAEIPRDEIEPVIREAVERARARSLRSSEVTPFLLACLRDSLGERAVDANVALLENNARLAARVAIALDRLSETPPTLV